MNLAHTSDAIVCRQCGARIPLFSGIPWFFEDPTYTLAEWRGRTQGFFRDIDLQIERLRSELQEPNLLEATRERVTSILQAKSEQKSIVYELLLPLLTAAGKVQKSIRSDRSYAMQSRLPGRQSLMSYYANVLRDWAWNTEENQVFLDTIWQALRPSLHCISPDWVLTLGAGAARLPYDLHRRLCPRHSLVMDFNPFLLFAAQKIIRGENLHLYEFPLAPKSQKSCAVHHTCQAPEALLENFHFLFADVMALPLQAGSFDLVLTPWLIDIIPQDFKDFVPRINYLLKPGALWVNFGSLGFEHGRFSCHYGPDETLEILRKTGFEILAYFQKDVPYLKSTNNCFNRTETTFTFCVRKVVDVQQPAPFRPFPEWIIDPEKNIPVQQEIRSAAAAHRTYAEVLSLIDGQHSIVDIATAIYQRYGISRNEACQSLKIFLTDFYESQLARPFRDDG
jgi:hypothetical protein